MTSPDDVPGVFVSEASLARRILAHRLTGESNLTLDVPELSGSAFGFGSSQGEAVAWRP